MTQPAKSSDQEVIDAANGRIDRLTGWFDRLVPLHRLRPLDRIPSIKLKLSILIVAAIGVTLVTSAIGLWLNVKPLWSLSAAVLVALVLVQILARGLTSPLREMARAADQMADGDLRQRVASTGRDEVGQLARSFNDMASHIADLERQRRDLIANVSHELRTPIAVIQGSVENLLDEVADDRDETLRAMLRQTQRLGTLVAQLMDLSRLEAGVAPLHPREIDLVGVVERVLEEARLRDPEPKLTMTSPQRLVVSADPERLHQVIANLVDNAVRYSPAAEPISIEVSRRADGQAQIVVTDAGPGIPPGELEQVFERFHRADRDRSAAGGGSGLGLAIAKWIVDMHNGSITAGHADPTGCVMTVRLPTST